MSNIEQSPQTEAELEYAKTVTKLRHRLETDIMKRYLEKNKLSKDHLPAWIKKYSEAFKKIFEREMEVSDANFWYNDEAIYRASVEVLEEELYKDEKPESLAQAA